MTKRFQATISDTTIEYLLSGTAEAIYSALSEMDKAGLKSGSYSTLNNQLEDVQAALERLNAN